MACHLLPTYRYPGIPHAEIAWRHHRRRRPSALLLIAAALRKFVIMPTVIVLLIPTVYFLTTIPSLRPKVSIDSFSITKFNATSTRDVSVEFEAMVRAELRLLGFSVRCFDRGSVSVSYSVVIVSPEFCRWAGRVTEFQTTSLGLLVSTLAVAHAFLYLAEARIDKRHRKISKWVLCRDMTVSEFLPTAVSDALHRLSLRAINILHRRPSPCRFHPPSSLALPPSMP